MKYLPHLLAPVAVMLIGGAVAKFVDATAGAAIVGVGTLLVGRVMPQPAALQKGDGG